MEVNSIFYEETGGTFVESLELLAERPRCVLWMTIREGRRLLLKGLPEKLRNHSEEIARLRKEYSLGMRLSHPAIVAVYGFEERDDIGPVIVMEYVDGITLSDYLLTPGSEKERLEIAVRIADGLCYAHDAGISHRDLKPDNILLTRTLLVPKIIDFGHGDSSDFAVFKKNGATEAFGAPEQLDNFDGNANSDVYSFGKILELLLPEPRFRKLIKQCLNTSLKERLKMKEVATLLQSNAGRRVKRLRVAVISLIMFLMLIISAFVIAYFLQNNHNTDDSLLVASNPEIVSESLIDTGAVIQIEKANVTDPHKQLPAVDKTGTVAKTSTATSSDIVEKYIIAVEKEIYSYGKLPYSYPFNDEVEQQRKNRIAKTYEIADKLEKALRDAGASEEEVSQKLLVYWTAVVNLTNRIDKEE